MSEKDVSKEFEDLEKELIQSKKFFDIEFSAAHAEISAAYQRLFSAAEKYGVPFAYENGKYTPKKIVEIYERLQKELGEDFEVEDLLDSIYKTCDVWLRTEYDDLLIDSAGWWEPSTC